jgi:hypothetical protein
MSINIGCLLCFNIFNEKNEQRAFFSPAIVPKLLKDEKVDIQGGS